MALKKVTDERDVTLSIAETLVVPAGSPYELRLQEVPDPDHGVEVRRISPTAKTGAGSGSCASGGDYSGLATKTYKAEIDTAGDIGGTATFKWSSDNGSTWSGTLIPIADALPIAIELDLTVQFGSGTGQDFNLGDYWIFTAEFWSAVSVIPVQTKEFQVNYVTGDVLFHSADAGKTINVSYEGRGSLVKAEDVNQLVDVLNNGETVLRMVNTSGFVAGKPVAVLSSSTFQLANATDGLKPAIGFVKVAHATEGEVILFGPLDGLAGLTEGARYYLDTVAGGITATPPSGQGSIKQVVGRALSTTRMLISINQEYVVNP